jgi:2-aminoadipate transaminase
VARSPLPLRQFDAQPGLIDLGWGHPGPELLPVDGIREASARVLSRYGPDALGYGAPAGPGPLIEWICDRLAATDTRSPNPDSVVISAGNSHAIDLLATLLTAPGDVVPIEEPTYHLAVRILQNHGVRLVPVPTDSHGLQVDALAQIVDTVRRRNDTVRLLYTVPTFHNPTGTSLDDDRRRQLVEFAEKEHLVILEDDAYRELAYDGPAPPSLWSMADPGSVVRLGTFAKSLAPGLRTGFITADSALTTRICEWGVLASGGGISHFSSLVVAEFAAAGDYARNVDRLRGAYRERRDALVAALSEQLASRVSWLHPAGGYFVWVTLLHERDAGALLPLAQAHGMSYMPGTTFYVGPPNGGERCLRLAFSRYRPDELADAVTRFARALDGRDH